MLIRKCLSFNKHAAAAVPPNNPNSLKNEIKNEKNKKKRKIFANCQLCFLVCFSSTSKLSGLTNQWRLVEGRHAQTVTGNAIYSANEIRETAYTKMCTKKHRQTYT